MAWTKACEGLTCVECGCEFAEGEDVYEDSAGDLWCEGCNDEHADAEAGRWEAEDYYDREGGDLIDGVGFADPGGNSALRAATPSNPRNLPCGTCGEPDRLTPLDKARGYQCDSCADACERGY